LITEQEELLRFQRVQTLNEIEETKLLLDLFPIETKNVKREIDQEPDRNKRTKEMIWLLRVMSSYSEILNSIERAFQNN